MNQIFQSIRGMNDILPKDLTILNYIKNVLKKTLDSYYYSEISMPILEKTTLFHRTIGSITDIVDKEMYSFIDQSGNSLTLRPEGTVGCVRACIEHGLIYNQCQRLWYIGPMFRHERPQLGRYRQFTQLGVETFGFHGPYIDLELIMITVKWWKNLNLLPYLFLEINTIGSIQSRELYKIDLIKFLNKNILHLDLDSKNKIFSNPLRIFDSKNLNTQHLLQNAPKLFDYLDTTSHVYFKTLCKLLDQMSIKYHINKALVRGLDYYNDTVFEWKTNVLGTQNTICAGGRYDSLVKDIVGHGVSIPAIGLAVGMERLFLLFNSIEHKKKFNHVIDINIFFSNCMMESIKLSEDIRNVFSSLKIVINYLNHSNKKQLRKAYKLCTICTLYMFNNEQQECIVTITNLKNNTEISVSVNEVIPQLKKIFQDKRN
ncbi:MAG: histidine--tRNA ligase [Buchnera aphidicola (Eriosoma harunire)]